MLKSSWSYSNERIGSACVAFGKLVAFKTCGLNHIDQIKLAV